MNSYVITLLPGPINGSVVFYGGYPTAADAMNAIRESGLGFSYQELRVLGPPSSSPPSSYAPVNVLEGTWLAVASGSSAAAARRQTAYGPFTDGVSACVWAAQGGIEGEFSAGLVVVNSVAMGPMDQIWGRYTIRIIGSGTFPAPVTWKGLVALNANQIIVHETAWLERWYGAQDAARLWCNRNP